MEGHRLHSEPTGGLAVDHHCAARGGQHKGRYGRVSFHSDAVVDLVDWGIVLRVLDAFVRSSAVTVRS